MIFTASLIGNWEKLTIGPPSNMAILGFLFMVCAIEVVLLKMTTLPHIISPNPTEYVDYDDSSEYEEDIYYEDLHNSYDHWARRRLRQQRQQQQREQELLRQFRRQQETQHHQRQLPVYSF